MTEVSTYVMPEADARRLTERIRHTAHTYTEAREKLIGYIEEARTGNAHEALGYRSWTEYLSDVLGEEPMRLARDERREVVALLSNEGMSTRAIAPIVGTSHMTAARDLDAGVTDVTPEAEPDESPDIDLSKVDRETGEIHGDGPAESLSEWRHRTLRDAEDNGKVVPLTGPGSASDPSPPKVTGLDGKEYTRPAPKPEPAKPKRRALTDQFFDATYDLTKVSERIERLASDDRFPQNAEKVATKHRSDLIRARDLLQEVINRLPSA